MTRLKVLISAYACRPGMGSEPGVGWNVARELANLHDVWVLTRSDNRSMIDAECAKNPIEGFNVIDFDLPGAYWWKRGLQSVHFHYYLWQIKAYFIARYLHHKVGLNIVHHVTYVKYSSPSFLALLPIPFIWGPVGGGELVPRAFRQDFHLRGNLYEALRNGVRFLGERDPFVGITARRSCAAYATTEDTAFRLKVLGCKNLKVLSQVGVSLEEMDEVVPRSPFDQEILRFISIGRLLHWKGFHLGLRAFAQASLPTGAEYWIVGKGTEETVLHTLANDLGISPQVQFFKEMPRAELFNQLGGCLALIHPSLHESGGFVCLEAMAACCPVICLDLGGPATQVTSATGFKASAHNPRQATAEMAKAMTRLATDPILRFQMGQAGRQRVKELYLWQAKAALFSQVYQKHTT